MDKYRPITGFGDYLVCADGYVLNIRTGSRLFGNKKRTGYREVCMHDDKGHKRSVLLHRLVAAAFCLLPGSTEGLEVNHKDGDKDNNKADNLEWTTHNENLRHAYETGLRENDVSARPVIGKNMQTGETVEFASIYKAARFLNISQGNICMACKGQRPNAGGYEWQYNGGQENE